MNEDNARAVRELPVDLDKDKTGKADAVSKEQVLRILSEIVESQEKMKTHMKDLTRELLAKPNMPFEDVYNRVRTVQPDDPLERLGLSMTDFDQLLNKHQDDKQVRDGIARFMGVPDASTAPSSDKRPPIDVDRIIEVHVFMLEELEKNVNYFATIKNKASYDNKTVTIAAQAMVGAMVEHKFKITSEDIERAVMQHHNNLAKNMEFASINIKMQQTMGKLMGQPV